MRSIDLPAVMSTVWQTLPIQLRRLGIWLLQPKYNVGAMAVSLNDDGNFLLVRHRLRETSDWTFPGGLLERGESPAETLTRELKEETGYDVEIGALLAAEPGTRWHLDLWYAARVHGGRFALDRRELLDAGFFPYAELSSLLSPGDMRLVDAARRHILGA